MGKNEHNTGHYMNMALKYLSHRPRSIFEMHRFFEKKNTQDSITLEIIDSLVEKNYLNDHDFAQLWVETRVRNNPKSKFALEYELKNKGIDSSIIYNVLEQYNDHDLAIDAVKTKIRTWKNLDAENLKKKMMNFLRYRGFNYEICISVFRYFNELKNNNWGETI